MNITRRPFSFNGDRRSKGGLAGAGTPEGDEPTWHDSLLGYVGGDPAVRDQAEAQMHALGLRAGVKLNYDVKTNWQPVRSQRLMMWAGRFGKQEEFMDVLGSKHFEQQQSASHTSTLLDAAAEVGLDVEAAAAFLETDELSDEVWKSYGDTIKIHGIRAIPYFIFGPEGMWSPFRPDGDQEPIIVNGSGDATQFLGVINALYARMTGLHEHTVSS